MTQQQFETRKERAENGIQIISKIEEGFRVYSPSAPAKSYIVSGSPEVPTCTCPDFQFHKSDPRWRCKHILAVLENTNNKPSANDGTEAEVADERHAIQEEAATPIRKQRAPRMPKPNGNGLAHMLIKRSISPDGRIDAVSVEFSTPVNGAPASEIKAQALRTLTLQNEIADAFLEMNGQDEERGGNEEPPASVQAGLPVNGEPVAAHLVDVGSMNGRFGKRFFINVNTNGKRLRLYGSPKQLATYIGYAGESIEATELAPGLRLNIPCRVVLNQGDNGYVTVTRVFRAALPPQKVRSGWQLPRS